MSFNFIFNKLYLFLDNYNLNKFIVEFFEGKFIVEFFEGKFIILLKLTFILSKEKSLNNR